jgi:hypothetical protein
MRFPKLAVVLLVLAPASPSFAQTVPDDVRCLLLSNVFSQKAADDRQKAAATMNKLFFMGRLDGRATGAAITRAFQDQARTIKVATAGAEMTACAARVRHAEEALQAAAKAAAPAPQKAPPKK